MALDVTVEDFFRVDVVERKADLYKPVHYFSFGKRSALPLFLLDVIGKISHLAEFHDDDKNALLNE